MARVWLVSSWSARHTCSRTSALADVVDRAEPGHAERAAADLQRVVADAESGCGDRRARPRRLAGRRRAAGAGDRRLELRLPALRAGVELAVTLRQIDRALARHFASPGLVWRHCATASLQRCSASSTCFTKRAARCRCRADTRPPLSGPPVSSRARDCRLGSGGHARRACRGRRRRRSRARSRADVGREELHRATAVLLGERGRDRASATPADFGVARRGDVVRGTRGPSRRRDRCPTTTGSRPGFFGPHALVILAPRRWSRLVGPTCSAAVCFRHRVRAFARQTASPGFCCRQRKTPSVHFCRRVRSWFVKRAAAAADRLSGSAAPACRGTSGRRRRGRRRWRTAACSRGSSRSTSPFSLSSMQLSQCSAQTGRGCSRVVALVEWLRRRPGPADAGAACRCTDPASGARPRPSVHGVPAGLGGLDDGSRCSGRCPDCRDRCMQVPVEQSVTQTASFGRVGALEVSGSHVSVCRRTCRWCRRGRRCRSPAGGSLAAIADVGRAGIVVVAAERVHHADAGFAMLVGGAEVAVRAVGVAWCRAGA